MDGVPGAIEVTQQAGDVLIFVDSVVSEIIPLPPFETPDHRGLS